MDKAYWLQWIIPVGHDPVSRGHLISKSGDDSGRVSVELLRFNVYPVVAQAS